MQCRAVLVHYCCRLGAAVATRLVEIHRVDNILAEMTFKCGAAIHRFGRVISHFSIVVLLPVQAWGKRCAPFEQERCPADFPITFGSDYLLEPVACGLKFAGLFSGGILLKTEFSTKLQAVGVNATAYAAKLPGGQTSVIILNKDAVTDLEVELDFGRSMGGVVETEILQAPALESREAHITTSTKIGSLKQGKCSVIISRATGLRLTAI